MHHPEWPAGLPTRSRDPVTLSMAAHTEIHGDGDTQIIDDDAADELASDEMETPRDSESKAQPGPRVAPQPQPKTPSAGAPSSITRFGRQNTWGRRILLGLPGLLLGWGGVTLMHEPRPSSVSEVQHEVLARLLRQQTHRLTSIEGTFLPLCIIVRLVRETAPTDACQKLFLAELPREHPILNLKAVALPSDIRQQALAALADHARRVATSANRSGALDAWAFGSMAAPANEAARFTELAVAALNASGSCRTIESSICQFKFLH